MPLASPMDSGAEPASPATAYGDDRDHCADTAAVLDWSPIATTVLAPSLCIMRASHSLCDAWGLPRVDACLGRDVVALLRELGILSTDDDEAHIRRALQTAAKQRTVHSVSTATTARGPAPAPASEPDPTSTQPLPSSSPGLLAVQPWRARIVPIVRDDVLLMLVVEWTQPPVPRPPDAATDVLKASPVTQPSSARLSSSPKAWRSAAHDPGALSARRPAAEHTEGKPSLTTTASANEFMHILIQTVKEYAIFLLDVDGNMATWNAGAELNKGYTHDEIIGKHFSIFYDAADVAAKKPWRELEECLRDGRVEDEGWRIRKDGSRFWANVTITPIYKDGVHVGFGKVTRDMTERRAAEQRVIAAYEESAQLKADFLANMSHEIRTPMHGMLSACSLLLHTPLTPEQHDAATIIDEAGQVLLRVIHDILDYSKLATGNVAARTDMVADLASITAAVAHSLQAALSPGVRLQLSLARDLPPAVQGDPLRYRQILQKIVANSAKFTAQGHVRVELSVCHDDDGDGDGDGDALVVLTKVTDTGIGIPAAARNNLFVPFTQVDATTKKRYQGTGLGLSICKALVDLMDGDIGYEPNPDQAGSVFWFTARFRRLQKLPDGDTAGTDREPTGRPVETAVGAALPIRGGRAPEAALAPNTKPNGWEAPLPKDAAADKLQRLRERAVGKRLLIVEDNAINQRVLLGLLRLFGVDSESVAVASDGSQAVARLCDATPAEARAYDLVLMDINMPVMDGLEATARIRQNGSTVPIVAMTAHALQGDRERCISLGMDDYIAKPVNKGVLVDKLLTWLPA